jgi:hypothetical protein
VLAEVVAALADDSDIGEFGLTDNLVGTPPGQLAPGASLGVLAA